MAKHTSVNVDDLMKYYGLSESVCTSEIQEVHLQEISCTLCERWRDLPTCFKMPKITSKDIDRDFKGEKERRKAFFSQWIEKDGSSATYKRLIAALLEVNCRDDAEGVCKLLKTSLDSRQEKSEESPEEKLKQNSTPVKPEDLIQNSSLALPKLAKEDSTLKLSNAPGTLS